MKFFNRNKITCASCGGLQIGGQWVDTVKEVRQYYKKEYSLDNGTIYLCPNCKTPWYLDKRETTLSSLWNTDRINEWLKVPNELPTEFKDKFYAIKATPPDFYVNGRDFIDLPCKVTLTDNKIIDFAMLRLQKDPPFINPYSYYKDYLTIDKVKKIEESEYALSTDLRLKTCQMREIRMGFTPTRVLGTNGVQYLLNGVTNFFYQDGIKGSDLTSVPKGQEKHEKDLVDSTQNFEIKIIVGHWDEKLIRARIEEY
jgi:hypothetical protein